MKYLIQILEKIYYLSPVVIQNFFCSITGYLILKRRYNKNFFEQLECFERKLFHSDLRMKIFLLNISNVPYYKHLFRKFCFNPTSIDVYDEIKKLPILTKDEAKKNIEYLCNHSYKGRVYKMKTSGTTGSGLVFPYSVEMENQQWAVWWRYRRWHGIDLDTWCGWFGGRSIMSIKEQKPPFWRINKPGKQVMFSAYHLNISTVKYYYDEIKKRQLTWLHGYPSQLSLFSYLIIECQLLPIISVTNITTGAENLLENQKEILKRVFPNAIIRQHYGLAEGVANISEDKNGNLVVDDDFCYIEFIPISKDTPDLCRIIGTGFSNEAFPLVRYDTGDIAKIEIDQNGIIKIVSIDGRNEDFITLPNGVKLGRLDHIFKGLTNIKEAQIHQKDVINIDFNIVKGSSYTLADETTLLEEIHKRINVNINIKINYVDNIKRTESGKLRFVISEIKDETNNPRP